MRWLAPGVIAGAVLVLVLAGLAGSGQVSADNPPHKAGAGVTADSCAGCHRAHTGQAKNLLTQDQPGLCYTCHGTGATGSDLDVQDGKVVSTGAALRGGGFSYALIDTTDATPDAVGALPTPGEAVTSWHTNDGSSVTMWGNGAVNATPSVGGSTDLRCGSCHDPHGNGLYRVLRPKPKGMGSGSDVNVTDEATPVYGTTNYWSVSYVTGTQISNWCSQCHTRYKASEGSEGTSSGDAIFTYRHRSDGSGTSPPCIKCHVSHGTNATLYPDAGKPTPGYSAQVPWPGGTPGPGDSSNSRLLKMDNRGVCQKCHNK